MRRKDIFKKVFEWSTGPGYRGVRQVRLGTSNKDAVEKQKLNKAIARFMSEFAHRAPEMPPRTPSSGPFNIKHLYRGTYGKAAATMIRNGYMDSKSYISFSPSAQVASSFTHPVGAIQSSSPYFMVLNRADVPHGTPWLWFQQGYHNKRWNRGSRTTRVIRHDQPFEREVLLPPGRLVAVIMPRHQVLGRVTPFLDAIKEKYARGFSNSVRLVKNGKKLRCSIASQTDVCTATADFLHVLDTLSFGKTKLKLVPVEPNDDELVAQVLSYARCIRGSSIDAITTDYFQRNYEYAKTTAMYGRRGYVTVVFYLPDASATSVNGKTKIIRSLTPKLDRNDPGSLANYMKTWKLFENTGSLSRPTRVEDGGVVKKMRTNVR